MTKFKQSIAIAMSFVAYMLILTLTLVCLPAHKLFLLLRKVHNILGFGIVDLINHFGEETDDDHKIF